IVERYSRRNHHPGETGQVDLERIGHGCPAFERGTGIVLPVPRDHFRPARQQRFGRGQAGPGEAQHRIASSAKGGGDDHLSLSVASPSRANMIDTSQKRITTVDSGQPSCSKWWWIGAMRKTRLPVRLNTITWMMTEAVSITNSPPITSSTIS